LLYAFDGQNIHDVLWKVKPVEENELLGDTLRVDLHFFVYDDSPTSGWETRADNVLSIESLPSSILLPTSRRALREESWFKNLEFALHLFQCCKPKKQYQRKSAPFRETTRDIFDLSIWAAGLTS
jgi:hypothetical protein